ncbi:MAG: Rad52/Rad22 family DNA repair protein, partial [Gemmatimonadaceae bacterium]
GVISWRQDGRPIQRDGKFFARFVAYVEANTVRERLDTVVPGEWDLTLELLPPMPGAPGSVSEDETQVSFKARLQILGVIREDVGTGRDYKSAATDAFKRAAVRFGVAHELYSFEQNWVQIDGDGKYAKPIEDPAAAYARRQGRTGRTDAPQHGDNCADTEVPQVVVTDGAAAAVGPRASDEPSCPKCGGRMWDNRASKRNPRAPDFKCRDRSCDGVIWPPRPTATAATSGPRTNGSAPLVPELEEVSTNNAGAENEEAPF